MWCDRVNNDGWGQVECGSDKKWKTKLVGGKKVFDCDIGLSAGRVPSTHCACYHRMKYNPVCCERLDCIVPSGSDGKICPHSPGNICDYCDPIKPECVMPGAKCLENADHEMFCGMDCETAACPKGYLCKKVKEVDGREIRQCLIQDLSCYF